MKTLLAGTKRRIAAGVLFSALLIGCAVPAWVATVETYVNIAASTAAAVVAVVDPAIGPIAMAVVAGINALEKVIADYKAKPTATTLQSVQAAIDAVNQNIDALESTAQIKNAGTQAEIAQLVAILDQAVANIGAQVPTTISVRRRALTNAVSAETLKNEYNAIAAKDPRLKSIQ